MSRIYFTSDLHFSHKNIFKFCPSTRGHFADINEMNEWIISTWNNKVTAEDTVYILGDVSFAGPSASAALVQRLNGSKVLIEGNHDRKNLLNEEFKNCFSEVHLYLERHLHNRHFVMFHFPIYDHSRSGRGSIMIHGHRHGKPTNIPGKIMDVGWDSTGKLLVDIDSVIHLMDQKKILYEEE